MKLNAGKRVLMFFHWLFSLLICAALTVYLIKPDWLIGIYQKVEGKIGAMQMKIIGGVILAIYVILAIVEIVIIFSRGSRADRGFITVDSSETGKVRIAISAVEQMVRQSVNNIDGIADMRISIDNPDDAILINVAASIINGFHVPTITMNMQRAIRQFVEMNCGVAVRTVSISINSVTNPGEGGKRKRKGKGEAAAAEIPVVPTYTPEPAAPAYTPAQPDPVAPAVDFVEDEPAYEAPGEEASAESTGYAAQDDPQPDAYLTEEEGASPFESDDGQM